MSTGTIPPPLAEPTPPPLPATAEQRLIDEQLDRTRAQVKTVDAAFGLLAMLVGALSLLLAAAVVDHWLFGLGTLGRAAAFAVLLGWVAYCAWRWIAPSLLRRINPLYAAHTIERHQPSLKNSLINYLLVRSHPQEAAVVRDALERQAAADIAHAPIETAVDRAHVLRMGYALVVVVLICAVYKVASPKDPFQTIARVLAPLAEISRPSRVAIREVTPGDAEVFHGFDLTVSAMVDGLRRGEEPVLLYSTADGQIVDAAVKMTADKSGRRWQAAAPPDPLGAQQDFRYRLRAGDAITEEYRVRVSPAPSIVVRSVYYAYPAYTRKPQTVEDHGDIGGVEGTRVTVRAEANQPIQSAWIEFDPPVGNGGLLTEKKADNASTLKRLPMKVDDRTATGAFRLEWDAQAGAPRHRHYRVRFATPEGLRNERPIVHALDVQRDLPPEVEILEPQQSRVEVPEDGLREIVIRAIDPDYGVSNVSLRAVVGGANLQIPALVNDPQGRTGQIVVKHTFTPRDHNLKAGDQVVYWARVEDNRTAPGRNTPEPNSARTQNYHLVITRPERSTSTAGESEGEKQEPSESERSGNDGSEKSEGDQGQGEQEQGEGQHGQGEQGQGSEGAGEGEKKQQGENGQGESESGESGKAEGQGGIGQGQAKQGESGQSDQSGGAPSQADNSSSNHQAGEQPNGQTSPHQGQSGADKQPANAGQQGGSPNQNQPSSDAQPSQRGGGQGGASPQNAQPQPGESSSEGQGDQQPVSPDGAQDREVFERIQEYLKEQQQKQGGSSESPTQANQPAGENAGHARPSQSPQPGEAPKSAAQRNPGESGKQAQQRQPDHRQGEADGQQAGGGQGGSPQRPAETQKEKPNPQKQPSAGQPKPGQGDSGDSGAGAPPKEPRGSPESQEANRDRQKNVEGGGEKKEGDEGASSPSTSKRQSDSQGGQGGDRSGGGEQGGGQGAKQQGNDSPGSSSAADEGAGAANEPGAGETSNQPGAQQQSKQPTGNTGDQPGEGSGTQQNPQGGSPQPAPSQNGRPGEAPSAPQNQQSGSPSSPNAAQNGNREGAGQHTFGAQSQAGHPDPNQSQDQTPPPPVPENAKVNLEYARKATDLALETLRDQKTRPDAELLEKLGWTPEELQRFLARWEAMKQAAVQEGAQGEEARQTLNETLESLGLRPTNTNLRRGATNADTQRGLRDSGHRSAPPPEYQKLFEAYLKGAGRAEGR